MPVKQTYTKYPFAMLIARLVGAGIFALAPFVFAAPETYSNQINPSSWSASTSVLSCRLSHSVPYFGEAVFRTRAGEASSFFLKASTARFKAGRSDLIVATPVWMKRQRADKITSVNLKQGARPLWLGRSETERMLSELNTGKEIRFVHPTWYGDKSQGAILSISNIGFREMYERYLTCLSGLIPRNYDQLKRTSLLFPKGETIDELPAEAVTKLDHILTLLKHDTAINTFLIDAHTDGEGSRKENLERSKMKAEAVANYLISGGVPESDIQVRWHGERYPVASNETAAGRAKNRRVTVRLDKVEKTLSTASVASPAENTE